MRIHQDIQDNKGVDMYTDKQFLAKIKPYVIADRNMNKICASLTAAQAFIESNKGNSGLAKHNNLFGMKGSYNGQYVQMYTKEYQLGHYVTVLAKFKKYPSWKDSIEDHSSLFNRLDRYKNLRGQFDYILATQYVKQDGYATSPTYTKTLRDVIEKYKLFLWDYDENPYRKPISIIKKNMAGNVIKWIQWQLALAGYDIIPDGIFGQKTENAIKAFQRTHSCGPVDGIAGPKTIAALEKVGE